MCQPYGRNLTIWRPFITIASSKHIELYRHWVTTCHWQESSTLSNQSQYTQQTNVQVLYMVCSPTQTQQTHVQLQNSLFPYVLSRTSYQSDLSVLDTLWYLLHLLNPCLRVQSQVFHHLKLSMQHHLRAGYAYWSVKHTFTQCTVNDDCHGYN